MRMAKFYDIEGLPVLVSPNSVFVMVENDSVVIKDIGAEDEQKNWMEVQGSIEEIETELNNALNNVEHIPINKCHKNFVDVIKVPTINNKEEVSTIYFDDEFPEFVYIRDEDLFYKVKRLGGSVATFLEPMTTDTPIGNRIVIE